MNQNAFPALRRFFALAAALVFCLVCCGSAAETPSSPPFEDGEFTGEAFTDDTNLVMLTESSFDADDIPQSYLSKAAHQGRVEKIFYYTSDVSASTLDDGSGGSSGGTAATTSADGETVKSVMVYFPAGYDESDGPYNVLYLIHGANSSPQTYLDPARPTNLQNLLDHMIEDGVIEPVIVMAATYFPADGSGQYLPLAEQVKYTAVFPQELVEDIIPQVEAQLKTYAASDSLEDIVASRDHRGIAGFSLGGVAAWYVFGRQMQAFRWFLPISEASWDDGEGGTSGIFDSDVSAQVLYDAVKELGFGEEDFMLFVATGSDDTAFEISTKQMISLLEYNDLFIVGKNTSCSMMSNGTHTVSALYTYLYHILPAIFAE